MIYVLFCTFELARNGQYWRGNLRSPDLFLIFRNCPLPYFGGNPLAGRAEIFSARKSKENYFVHRLTKLNEMIEADKTKTKRKSFALFYFFSLKPCISQKKCVPLHPK